jgi:Transposase
MACARGLCSASSSNRPVPITRAFEPALGVAGVPYAKVNPRQARRFAEAIGSLAKTDRLDGAMLARMGAMSELKTRPPRSDALLALKQLHYAREALVKDRRFAKNRTKVLTRVPAEASQCAAPRADRSPDCGDRGGNPRADQS